MLRHLFISFIPEVLGTETLGSPYDTVSEAPCLEKHPRPQTGGHLPCEMGEGGGALVWIFSCPQPTEQALCAGEAVAALSPP